MSTYAARRAIYGKLAGDTTLNNLLHSPPTGYSKSIYFDLAPAEALQPYVIFSKQSGTPRYALDTASGEPAMDNELWLVKGVDRNEGVSDIAESIAARINTVLTDGTISISGKTDRYLRRESDVDYSEVDGDKIYRHSGAVFRLMYT